MYNLKSVEQASLDQKIKVSFPKKSAYFTTSRIAYLAMLIAINVAIGAISPRMGTMKITLTYTMCFFAGYFFGGIAGILVGGIGDLLGCLLATGAPNPIMLLSSCLIGFFPALAKILLTKINFKGLPYLQILLSYLFCYCVCTLFLNTYALYIMGLSKGATFWAYLVTRVAVQTPIVLMNLALTFAMFPLFKKIFKLFSKNA